MLTPDLYGRDFLALEDFAPSEIASLLALARELKERFRRGDRPEILRGQGVGLLFRKSSTRTRVSFEVGIRQLGGESYYLGVGDLQLGRGETIADTARVLSRYLQGLVVRTYSQDEIRELAAEASIPVINGLTDLHHPCQVLADLLTLEERFGRLGGLPFAYVGDGNNMANSLLIGGAQLGLDVRVATPAGFRPDPGVLARAEEIASTTGARVRLFEDPREAVQGAAAIYTDTWVSMGQEEERERRLQVFEPYRVTEDLFRTALPEAVFLHCLPAHRGEEVEERVIDGPRSLVWEQAENRLHAQKAVLAALL